ncbi:PREDICTED: beta-carotene isomerase D27, chloroplastic-like [Camelina sativa]|uniref:Beta-carotene isomerase D27, chloroplastic-like n=1 Tax=Camelina sativa TaxID=90675 RepID=A0ABM0X6L6_CAMSA|nr:PREDICTED: beta-carotene isomerase D27, chloroplastic-like [Camelina sativa]
MMNTKLSLSHTKILTFTGRFNDTRTRSGLDRRSIVSPTLSSKPIYSGGLKATKETAVTEPSNTKNVSNIEDSFFSKIAIKYLSKNLQDAAGMSSSSTMSTDYDRLVDTATRVARNFDTKQQHELVLSSLDRALPAEISSLIKMLFPPSKLSRELFALFTTISFAWLVGPSEVRETEVNGRKEKSVVFIEKCRFLEQSNCVGMCTHICKIPSQIFMKNSLGMPIYMEPDFNDLSCKMMFGREPPEIQDDPVMKQPCFEFCKSNKSYGVKH